MNSEEVKALLAAFDDLVDIKILIRKIAPKYELDSLLNEELLFLLNKLKLKLQPLFSKYLTQENPVKTEDFKIARKNTILEAISNDNIVLISANSSKKKLKSMGVDPRRIIVSGGPLFVEDYKVVNPNLPDKALPSIKKKCERILDELKHEKWAGSELIFVHEEENATDKLILEKLEQVSKLIQKKINTINVGSWDMLND
jgi:hypothetical protein